MSALGMGIEIDPNTRCDTTAEGAALGLLGLMTGISEEFWCAGWLIGLEFDLWNAAMKTGKDHTKIGKRLEILLRLLSEECDGWWYWKNDADNNPRFIRLTEWREIVDRNSDGELR